MSKNELLPCFTREIFIKSNQNYNFTDDVEFQRNCMQTVHYGTDAVSSLGSKIWEMLSKAFY